MLHEFDQQLKDFIKTVKEVKIPKPENTNSILPDLGLIIMDNDSLNFDNIITSLGEIAKYQIDLDRFSNEIFINKLTNINSEGKWLFVNCTEEPSPEITQILNQIATDGSFTTTVDLNKPLKKITIDQNTRIIFIVKNSILENFVNPYFLNMFGPVLRIK